MFQSSEVRVPGFQSGPNGELVPNPGSYRAHLTAKITTRDRLRDQTFGMVADLRIRGFGPFQIAIGMDPDGAGRVIVPAGWPDREEWKTAIEQAIRADWAPALGTCPIPPPTPETRPVADAAAGAAKAPTASRRRPQAEVEAAWIAAAATLTGRRRRLAEWHAALETARRMKTEVAQHVAALTAGRGAALLAGDAGALKRIDQDIAASRPHGETFATLAETIASVLPQIERTEAETLAALRRDYETLAKTKAAAVVRVRAAWEPMPEAAAALAEYVAADAATAGFRSRLHTLGINHDELGIDAWPGLQFSFPVGPRASEDPLQKLRIPGIAPADAAERPAWIHLRMA